MANQPTFSELSIFMGKTLLSKGAFDVEILDLTKKSKLAQNLIVCTANSTDNAKQICSDFCQEMEQNNIELFAMDGFNKGEWIVLDYDSVIIHIFLKQLREKYSLEKLWR